MNTNLRQGDPCIVLAPGLVLDGIFEEDHGDSVYVTIDGRTLAVPKDEAVVTRPLGTRNVEQWEPTRGSVGHED